VRFYYITFCFLLKKKLVAFLEICKYVWMSLLSSCVEGYKYVWQWNKCSVIKSCVENHKSFLSDVSTGFVLVKNNVNIEGCTRKPELLKISHPEYALCVHCYWMKEEKQPSV
jgi:hypothetical protein